MLSPTSDKSQAAAWLLFFMRKTSLLLGLLLAAPLQAMDLLSTAAKAYADATKSLTICYPALILLPYLEESGGLLIDQMERLAEQLPFPLLHEKLPNWSAVQRGLQEGRCDLIPNVGPSLQALPGMALSRAMLEAESAILYRGDLERATFLVSPIWQANEVLKALYPRSTQLPLTEADNWYAALAAGKGTAYLGDYLQLRYLMREYPDQGLRLRRLRSDELVVSYRLMMRDQPELRELIDTAIRYLPPGALYKDLDRYLAQGSRTSTRFTSPTRNRPGWSAPPVPSSWSSTRISCPTAVSTSRGTQGVERRRTAAGESADRPQLSCDPDRQQGRGAGEAAQR